MRSGDARGRDGVGRGQWLEPRARNPPPRLNPSSSASGMCDLGLPGLGTPDPSKGENETADLVGCLEDYTELMGVHSWCWRGLVLVQSWKLELFLLNVATCKSRDSFRECLSLRSALVSLSSLSDHLQGG